MAIVYGTGSYTMQRFSPSDLGLMSNDLSGHEFRVMKRYAHLYWIPIFPLETIYTVSKPGSSDKYAVSENIKSLMQSQNVPFWKNLGAFALPLILIFGFFGYQVSESYERAESEKQFQAFSAQSKQTIADTIALRPYANQFIQLIDFIEKSDLEKAAPIKKIDTSRVKIFSLMIETMINDRDTTIAYTRNNTFIHIRDFEKLGRSDDSEESEENMVEKDNFTQYRNDIYSNGLQDEEILKWYYSNFKENTPTRIYPDKIKKINEHLAEIQYFAKVNIVGFAKPTIDEAKEGFSSGYIQAKVMVHDLKTNKIIDKYSLLVSNNKSISYTEKYTDLNSRLLNDLKGELRKEIWTSLRIKTRNNYQF